MTFSRWTVAAVLLIFTSLPAAAQTADPKPPSTYDRIWAKLTDWYNDKENPVVQRVLFTGRFHHDLALVEADQGDWRESNIRRVRFGSRVTLFRDFLVHAEVEVNPQEREPFYMRMTDAYVAWQKHPKSVIQVGKQAVGFTQEGATSSRELLTIDRSNLANNIWFTQEYMPGVSVSGRVAPWNYRAGVYSSGSMNREFGRFDGGVFTMATLGYDLAKKLGVREAVVTGNYLYQQPDALNTFTRRFEHIGSLNFRLEQPRWGFRADVSKTAGYLGQRDVLGVMAMPFVNATSKLQFVARYTFLESDGNNGLSLATYENKVTRGNGDRYQEAYAGANYFFYGHRLKLQTGVQFADMRDRANDGGAYSGVSWTTGLRVGW
ncbi:MAG TPA: porin [Vicinamibacterales bacterium]|nr:porin [Vicinamibacterales bacterium]